MHWLRRTRGAELEKHQDNARSVGSAFGRQAESHKRSAPGAGFGDPQRSVPALAAAAALKPPPQRFRERTSPTLPEGVPGPGAYDAHISY